VLRTKLALLRTAGRLPACDPSYLAAIVSRSGAIFGRAVLRPSEEKASYKDQDEQYGHAGGAGGGGDGQRAVIWWLSAARSEAGNGENARLYGTGRGKGQTASG